MPKYIFHLSDGKQIDVEIEAKNKDEAFSAALTALSTYASSKFPPPENIEIQVMDSDRLRLATFRFVFEVDIAEPKGTLIPFPSR